MFKCDVCKGQGGTSKVYECVRECEDGTFCKPAQDAKAKALAKWNMRARNVE